MKVNQLVLDPSKSDLQTSLLDTLCFRLHGTEWEVWGSRKVSECGVGGWVSGGSCH